MDNLLTISFEAHSAERNHHRQYKASLGRDLLGDWTLAIRYGRTGQGCREIRFGSPSPETIRQLLRQRLKRRLSAPKRIGCPYRLTSYSAAPTIDPSAWLPGDVIAEFFHPASPLK